MTTYMKKHLDSLDKELDELLEYLRPYTDEMLNTRPGPGRWSALQVMHHLMKTEALSLQYVRKKLSFNPRLKRAGFLTASRSFLLDIYFRLPFKFKAPEVVSEASLPENSSFEEVHVQWLDLRRQLREFLAGLPGDTLGREIYRHPFAGRLSGRGMIRFFSGHFMRHKKQIERTIQAVTDQA
jgi:hypothetical protein